MRSARLLVAVAVLGLMALAAGVLPVQGQGQPPSVPTGLAASPTHEAVGLSWDDPDDPSITHYEVYRRDIPIDDVGVFHLIEPNTGSAATSYVDTSVAAERSYVYRVKAVNAHGASQWSRFARADTPAAPVIERIPEEPLVALPQMSVATLVKNTGQTAESSGLALSSTTPRRPQAFTTGANPAGYALSSIGIQFQAIDTPASAGGELTVTLNTDDSGSPGDALCTLADPASFSANSLNTFTAPTTGMGACPALTMETTYFVVVTRANDTTDSIELSYTDSDSEDTLTPATNWAIGDDRQGYDGTTWTTDAGESLMLEVTGAAENNPATGAPSVHGILQQDEELAADTVGIADATDGLTSPTFTYQWIRVDSSDVETPISGETSSTYTLTAADVDHKIKLKIDFSDDAGNAESLTSIATPVVVETGATHRLLWAATLGVEMTEGEREQPDGTTNPARFGYRRGVAGSLAPSTFSYGSETFEVTGFLGTAFPEFIIARNAGAADNQDARWTFVIGDTHRFALDDQNVTVGLVDTNDPASELAAVWLTVSVPPWSGGETVSVFLEQPLNSKPEGAPSIQGVLQSGKELSASTAGVSDADGIPDNDLDGAPDFTYQWIRVDGMGVETSVGTDSSTYTLASADVGHTIKVAVSFTDEGSSVETSTSAATPAVVASGATSELVWLASLTVFESSNAAGTLYGFGAVSPNIIESGGATYEIVQLFEDRSANELVLNLYPGPEQETTDPLDLWRRNQRGQL